MPAADAPPHAEAELPAGLILTFEEGDHRNVALLGGKGAGLVRMTAAGLPVPPGFIITTEVCRERLRDGKAPAGLAQSVARYVRALEGRAGRSFGRGPAPLLVSVRSGAPVSMPGMMDTILNLGLNAETAEALARETGDPPFAANVFVRFLRMYGEIVLGAAGEGIARATAPLLAQLRDNEQSVTFEQLAAAAQGALEDECGARVPSDAVAQLSGAIGAVFDSWNSRRAITYRKFHGIGETLGTAVVVQTMVFGNLGSPSGTGVAFSRNPLTGEPELFGEFLEGGQGEDVVAGTTTPAKIAVAAERFPELFAEFDAVARRLEDLYRDVVDIEFTVERGRLYVLQVRSAKRTARAALRFAADFLSEGRLSESEALRGVSLAQVRQLGRPGFESAAVAQAKADGRLLAAGIGASPGQVSGIVSLDPDRAEAAAKTGQHVILVRPTTSPHDLHGMIAADGILTSLGGATSHAAVVARALNKPCVVGCDHLIIDAATRRFRFDGAWFGEGTEVSIDGSSGEIFAGALALASSAQTLPPTAALFAAADRLARSRIFARVATPQQVLAALDHGATGVMIRLGDVLATSGRLQEVVDAVLASRGAGGALGTMPERLADLLAPLLEAAGNTDFMLRAIDLGTGEAAEALGTVDLFAREPRLALPLGVPELIGAQARGLALALERTGYGGRAHFTVRHVVDPSEMREFSALTDSSMSAAVRENVATGATITSLRGALMAGDIAEHADSLWVEVRSLLAGAFGYPPSVMLTAEPLDDYVRRGLLGADPRAELDDSMVRILLGVAAAAVKTPACRVGVRLSGAFSEQMAATLYRIGFRAFVVDLDEVRAARIALGKEAAQ
jgi:pyruvate,orthophosphate dikinase